MPQTPTDYLGKTYVVVDLETTGTDTRKCGIIQVGMAKYRLDEGFSAVLLDTYEHFVEPACAYPKEVEEITGITLEDLKGAPYIQDLEGEIFEFLEGADCVLSYNGQSFDWKFLAKAFTEGRWGGFLDHLPMGDIDVMKLVKHRMVGKAWCTDGAHKLGSAFFRCTGERPDPEQQHTAAYDCMMTFEVFKHILMEFPNAVTGEPLENPDIWALFGTLRKNRAAYEEYVRAAEVLNLRGKEDGRLPEVDGFRVEVKETKGRKKLRKGMKVPDEYYEPGTPGISVLIKEIL